jgi:hypothetical protein
VWLCGGNLATSPSLLLTDTLDGDDGAIEDGDRVGERPNDQRGAVASGNGGDEGDDEGGGVGACGCASRVETALLPLVIARRDGG